ncbi:alpha-L-rhamnosidase-related protein [Lentilactobacillus diolivorans]|uniref:Bacterial alpha-L-rhamnosidase n=2 Tax=Lentilactobacillus diolivorans TaxID=179838 RepID=A0A0R1SSC7_9LACO|nr:family 78 glycoside hydrolase catalytic domain [Lentilactobacillus diolivorans]KRL69141.1 bacterial alpha-L-rhamnosidase [Lentilactobacillus diolivorans DSM 14421]GEP22410.1 alpha-L-rhamnosidase [Lentilactobacillus diolivorans]
MAFTFQINNNVAFKHDQRLIDKADMFKPQLYKQKIGAKSLVALNNDASFLEGVGIKRVDDIQNLASHQLTRDQKIILDFGDHQVGKFSVDISSAGSPMDAPLFCKFKFAEMPAELAHKSSDYDGWLSKSWIQEEYIHIDELPTRLVLPRRYSFRYVEITVLDTSPKWQAVFDHPLVDTETSADLSQVTTPQLNDPELEKIYQVGVKTLADCMQNVFEDGPKRDRRLWIGDLRLQALANYATFRDRDLVKRCLYLFGAMTASDGRVPANVFTTPNYVPDDTFLFDYSLFFISILADLETFQMDQTVLDDLYPIAKQQMDLSLERVNRSGKLVLDDDYPVFIDWSNDFDKETAGQAVLIYVLRQFIDLAQQKSDEDLDKYRVVLEKMIQYSKTSLYDPSRGLFISGNNHEINIASQVWMVLAKVMDSDTNQQIMQRTCDDLFPIRGIATPYMYHHVTEALFQTGLRDQAIDLLKDYWGTMIKLGADTYWEAFEPEKPDYSPYGSPILNSYCHAWSCTPVYLIQKYLTKGM